MRGHLFKESGRGVISTWPPHFGYTNRVNLIRFREVYNPSQAEAGKTGEPTPALLFATAALAAALSAVPLGSNLGSARSPKGSQRCGPLPTRPQGFLRVITLFIGEKR